MKKLALSVFGAAMLAASPAMAAVTFDATITNVSTPGAGETVIDNFNSAAGTAFTSYTGSFYVGPSTGGAAAPFGGSGNFFAVPNVAPSPANGTGFIDLTKYIAANGAIRTLSFIWGSVDSYNTIAFLDNFDNVIGSFTGTQIAQNPIVASGGQATAASNPRVFFTFGAGDNVTKLRLTSTSRAFEIDSLAVSAVPEPSTWAMMLFGFGIVGFSMRRRRGITASFA